MSTAAWFAFATATLAATGSPGPNAMLIVRNTARYGLRAAALTVSGNLCARIAMASAVMLGLNALLNASPMIALALRLAGALYLIYLGAKALAVRRGAIAALPVAGRQGRPRAVLMLQASIVSLVNPNTLGFFVAAIPQLINVKTPLAPQLAVLLAIDVSVVLFVMTSYAMATHLLHRKVTTHGRMVALRRGGGTVLIIVGVTMLPLH